MNGIFKRGCRSENTRQMISKKIWCYSDIVSGFCNSDFLPLYRADHPTYNQFMIQFVQLAGAKIIPSIDSAAKMRINFFREYPYLYAGTLEHEREYFGGFSQDPRALLILATLHQRIIAVSTAMPLVSNADILKDAEKVFRQSGCPPENFYYYGEVIVLPEHRQKGIARKIFALQDAHAKKLGFNKTCLATVIRSETDPRKPDGFPDTDPVWRHLGYKKQDLWIDYHWPTIQTDGSVSDLLNPMVFWTKNLD